MLRDRGGVAQVVRANGSYPLCPGFDSLHRHHPFLKQFRRDLKGLPLGDGDRVLVAVSGGGDSAGLLALLLSARPRPDLALGVAHVHHNLRGPEADRDEAAVKGLAKALGLPFCRVKLRGKPARGQSTEEWAREGRYAALERLRAKGSWDWVATAHTLDDQAETVLMRIARGTGIHGLSGIHPVSGRVVRPALGLTGAQLREAAKACGLAWLEDSSNADRRYLRNRIRAEVLPTLEAAVPGISARLAALARLAREARPAAPPAIARVEGDTVYYECDALSGLAEGQALELFREGLRTVRGDLRRIAERHLRALWALRTAKPGGVVALPGGWAGVREPRGIRLGPAAPRQRRTR
jgi:tRNA(Ile)-lysidine synthase